MNENKQTNYPNPAIATAKNPNDSNAIPENVEKAVSPASGLASGVEAEGSKPKLDMEGMTVDEKIKALRSEMSDGVRANPVKKRPANNYKDEGGRPTFFYKNISNMGIILPGDKVRETWDPGGLMNFFDYFDGADEILNNREIKRLENPLRGPIYIKRLTPGEYLRELQIQMDIEKKANALLNDAQEKDGKIKTEEISNTVTNQINLLLTYEAYTDVEKKSSSYTKYDFIKWLRTYNFNGAEHRWMNYQIRDPEVQRALLDRKTEIEALSAP